MRVLLVNPPFPVFPNYPRHASPPLGLAYLAATLERAGHEVRIVDCIVEGFDVVSNIEPGLRVHGLPADRLIALAGPQPPDVVGLACVFSTLDRVVRRFAAQLKAAWPGAPIVVGGAHATALAAEVARDVSIDYVIRGEGELAFAQLVEHLEGRRPLREVAGLTWADGVTVYETEQAFVDNIDTLPLPARHLLDMDAYARIGQMQGMGGGGGATTLITSRGCPARCRFCSIHGVWGRRFRPHSPGRVIDEICELYLRYNVRHLLFEDDNLTFDRERAKAIFRGILDRGLDITWAAPNGVALWTLDDELLGLIRATGCTRLSLGVESGDPDTLRRIIRKPLRLERVEELARQCRKLGIATTAFFVVGLPGETLESMSRSLDYAERLPVDSICVSIAAPFPGTGIYDECKEKGYLAEGFTYDRLMTQIGQIRTPEFTPADVERLVAKTHLRRAMRHPRATLVRLAEKFRGAPRETLSFVVGRTVSKLLKRSA